MKQFGAFGSTINFDSVRKIGLALPGVEESTAYGSPALKVRGKLLACVPSHRSAEPADRERTEAVPRNSNKFFRMMVARDGVEPPT
jgi:hypothetical protein